MNAFETARKGHDDIEEATERLAAAKKATKKDQLRGSSPKAYVDAKSKLDEVRTKFRKETSPDMRYAIAIVKAAERGEVSTGTGASVSPDAVRRRQNNPRTIAKGG